MMDVMRVLTRAYAYRRKQHTTTLTNTHTHTHHAHTQHTKKGVVSQQFEDLHNKGKVFSTDDSAKDADASKKKR